jgi:hypothetical protein
VRTTLEIDDDVMEAAMALSRRNEQDLDRTISELARKGLAPEREAVVVDHQGISTWIHGPGAIPVTGALVRNLLDEE